MAFVGVGLPGSRAGGRARLDAVPRGRGRCCAAPRLRSRQRHRVVAEFSDGFVEVEGTKVGYKYEPGLKPTVVFLPGFYDARQRDAKINAMEIFCRRKRQGILVPEYYGTGSSDGEFKDGTVSRWLTDSLAAIDDALGPDARCVLVGAGVGGWIMLHIALMRPKMTIGLVGMSADPDFTEDLIYPNMTDEQKAKMDQDGVVDMLWGNQSYPISAKLIEDGNKMGLLNGEPGQLDIRCPVRLIQGLKDEEIPPERALTLINRVASTDATVTFVKNGDHRLDSDDDFVRAWESICDLSDKFFEYDLTSPGSG